MAQHPSSRIPIFTSVFNITLTLFFFGLFVFIAFGGNELINRLLQIPNFKIVLSENITSDERKALENKLRAQPWVAELKYVSKEEAWKTHFKNAGEDFVDFQEGLNPLPSIFRVKLRLDYINADSVLKVSQPLLEDKDVRDVYYPIREIETATENVGRIKIFAVVIGLLLALVALFLIVNTVRLAIYAKRLVIRSMQLIGATNRFIRAPFLRIGSLQGLIAGALAALLIFLTMEGVAAVAGVDLALLTSNLKIYLLYFGLTVFGGVMGFASSAIAVNRYLDKQLDHIM